MNNGLIFVVSGPSGSGKDTILRELFKRDQSIKFSISSTTRPMREEDKAEKKYDFISRESFEALIERDEFLEYNEYAGNYYGTPKAQVLKATDGGSDIIIEVDVNGAFNIRKKMPEAVSIFIMPPSFKELERRLTGRGSESDEVIEKRMKNALGEIERATEYDYIVVNDNIANAVEDLAAIIKSEKLRINNQKNIINEVLEKC